MFLETHNGPLERQTGVKCTRLTPQTLVLQSSHFRFLQREQRLVIILTTIVTITITMVITKFSVFSATRVATCSVAVPQVTSTVARGGTKCFNRRWRGELATLDLDKKLNKLITLDLNHHHRHPHHHHHHGAYPCSARLTVAIGVTVGAATAILLLAIVCCVCCPWSVVNN